MIPLSITYSVQSQRTDVPIFVPPSYEPLPPPSLSGENLLVERGQLADLIYSIDIDRDNILEHLKPYIDEGWQLLATSDEYLKIQLTKARDEFYEHYLPIITSSASQESKAEQLRPLRDELNNKGKDFGYYGIALIHPESAHLIVVSKGTDPNLRKAMLNGDILDADVSIFLDKPSHQSAVAIGFAKHSESLAKESLPGYSIFRETVGHSQAGHQSHLIAAKFGWERAVGYDLPILSKKVLSSYGIPFDKIKNDDAFISVISTPNIVNRAGGADKYGQIWQITPDGTETTALASHRMSGYILPALNAKRYSKTRELHDSPPSDKILSSAPPRGQQVNDPAVVLPQLLSDMEETEKKLEALLSSMKVPTEATVTQAIDDETMALAKAPAISEEVEKHIRDKSITENLVTFSQVAAESYLSLLARRRQSQAVKAADKEFARDFRREKRHLEFQNSLPVSLPTLERILPPQPHFFKCAQEIREISNRLEQRRLNLLQEIEDRTALGKEIDAHQGESYAYQQRIEEWHKDRMKDLLQIQKPLTALKIWVSAVTVAVTIVNPGAGVAVGALGGAAVSHLESSVSQKTDKETQRYQRLIRDLMQHYQHVYAIANYNQTELDAAIHQQSIEALQFISSKFDQEPDKYRQGLEDRLEPLRETFQGYEDEVTELQETIRIKEEEAIQANKNAEDMWKLEFNASGKEQTEFHNKGDEFAKQNQAARAAVVAAKAALPAAMKKRDNYKEDFLDPVEKEYKITIATTAIHDVIYNAIQENINPDGLDPVAFGIRKRIAELWSEHDRSKSGSRHLAAVITKAASQLAREIDFYLQSDKSRTLVEIGSQLYQLNDLGKDIRTALKILDDDWDKIKEGWEKDGVDGTIEALGGMATFTERYLIPGIAAVGTTVTILRLCYKFFDDRPTPLTPEQRLYLDTLSDAAKKLHDHVEQRFDELEKILADKHEELKTKVSSLKSDLIIVGEEIIQEVHKSAKETQATTVDSHYANFIRDIDEKTTKIPLIDSSERFFMWLKQSLIPGNNGFTPGFKEPRTGRSRHPHPFRPDMKRNPEYFTGLLGDIAGIKGVPNYVMFTALANRFFDCHEDFPEVRRELIRSGRQLQTFFNSLSPIIEKTVNRQRQIIAALTHNKKQICDLKRSLDRGGAFTEEQLEEEKVALLGSRLVGEKKFLLAQRLTTTLVSTRESFKLDSKDNIQKFRFTTDISVTAGTTAGVAFGALALLTGGSALVFLPVFGYMTAVTAGEVIALQGTDVVQRGMSAETFYRKVDVDFTRYMKQPARELLSKTFCANCWDCRHNAANIATGLALRRVKIMSKWSLNCSWYYYNVTWGRGEFSKKTQYTVETVPTLLEIATNFDIGRLNVNHACTDRSILKERDVKKIIPVDTEGYNQRIKNLLSDYYDYLKHRNCGKELPEQNLFREISPTLEKVKPTRVGLPELLLPKKLISHLIVFHASDEEKMAKTGAGALITLYDFVQSPDENSWSLQVHFRFVGPAGDKAKEFRGRTIATFDKYTVDAFREIDGESNMYQPGELNLSEFLIQMNFCGLIEQMGLPGDKSHIIESKEWIAPVDRPFVGCYKLWEVAPHCQIHYNSAHYTEEVQEKLEEFVANNDRATPPPQFLKAWHPVTEGKDLISVWRDLRAAEKETLGKFREKYRRSYDTLIATCRCISGLSHEDLDYYLQSRLHLVPPDQLETFIENSEKPQALGTIGSVADFLQETPSIYKLELDAIMERLASRFHGGIVNGGNSCFIAAALQAICGIPLLIELFSGKDDPVKSLGREILNTIRSSRTVTVEKIRSFREACFHAGLCESAMRMEDSHKFLGKLLYHLGQNLRISWRCKTEFISPLAEEPSSSDVSALSSIEEHKKWLEDPCNLEVSPFSTEKGEIVTDMQAMLNHFWRTEEIEGVAARREGKRVVGKARRHKEPVVSSPPEVLTVNVKQTGVRVLPKKVDTLKHAWPNGPEYRLAAVIEYQAGPPKHYITRVRTADGEIVECNDTIITNVGSFEGCPGVSYLYKKVS